MCGCNLDSNFGDLGEKLLDPDVQGFDAPGVRLLEGPYFDLDVQANETGARFALARSAEGELAIVDFERQAHCRAGGVARYGNAVLAPGQPALVPLLIADSGAPRLTFTSFACERSAFEIEAAGLPEAVVTDLPTGSGSGILVRTPERGLSLVDPWVQTSRLLAASVRDNDPIRAFNHFLWVDRGVITISDPTLEPIAYYGQNVSEVNLSAEDAELAYIEAGATAGAGGTLFVVNATAREEPREVARDACLVRYLTVDGRRKLVYLSPCAERRLVLHDRENGEARVIASNVAGGPALRAVGGETALTYVTTESSSVASGTLWLLRGDAEPVAIAENVRANQSPVSERGSLLALVDWASTGGRLVEWDGVGLNDVAQSVIEIAPLGRLENEDLTLLANFDGTTGDLLALGADLSTSLLASGVPTRSAEGDAFLANFADGAGELHLLDRADGSSQLLGTGVARGSFRFAVQFNGVMMLSDRDMASNTTTLSVLLLDTMQRHVLHDGVTEAREVAFPSPGLLYNVVAGDELGIWFSKTL